MFDVTVKLANLAARSRTEEVSWLVDASSTLPWIPRGILQKLSVVAFSRLPFSLADGRRLERDVTAVPLTFEVAFAREGAAPGATRLEGPGFLVDPIRKKLVPRDRLAL